MEAHSGVTRRRLGRTVVALALIAAPASAADDATCRDYARKTIEQVRLGQQRRCAGMQPPAWSDNSDLHYGWCRTVEPALLQAELGKRDELLRSCGALATPAPGAIQLQTGTRAVVPAPPPQLEQGAAGAEGLSLAPPRLAPLPEGARALDNLGTVSQLYTLPVAPWVYNQDFPRVGKNAIDCVLLNVAPSPRTVEIAFLRYGTKFHAKAFRVPPRDIARLVFEPGGQGYTYSTDGPVSCAFRVEGASSDYRAGAVVYGRGNPTSHPAY
jgi:hypothetical protein